MFLHLSGNFLADEGLQALARNHFPNLVDLRLSNTGDNADQNRIAVLENLDEINFPRLQYLYLSQNNITDEGAVTLAKSNWNSLYVIMLCTCCDELAYNTLTNSGAETLQKAKWTGIEAVFLDFNRITKKRAELKFSNPDTFVFV